MQETAQNKSKNERGKKININGGENKKDRINIKGRQDKKQIKED